MINQKGQTLLVVVLIMVVALTVGLAVASRSITNLRITTEEQNSQRAFSAAEAGVEKALKLSMNSNIGIDASNLDNQSLIKSVSIEKIDGAEFLVNGGETIQKDDGADIWLVEHNGPNDSPNYSSTWTGTLNIYWGNAACAVNNIAAVELILITGDSSNPKSWRYAVDPCSDRRGGGTGNNFEPPTEQKSFFNVSETNFVYRYALPVNSGIILRVVPLYQNAKIGVSGSGILPNQGRKIESIGESGGTQRKVSFYQGYPKLPAEFFQYSLFCTNASGDDSSCR